MSGMLELIRQVVREEMALFRGPLLATVGAVYAHEDADDTANFDADVTLKHDGLELKRVPLAVTHVGAAAPPRVGDLVLLEFLDHDVQQPLVVGRFYHDQERAPLFKEDEVLFEHRLPDGKLNHLRFAADGSIVLQRDVTKPADNSEFAAGVKIGADGTIEVKTGDKVLVTLKDGEIEILCDGGPVKVTCDELTVDGKLTVTGDSVVEGKLTVTGDSALEAKLKVGKIIGVTIDGTEISGGPL
jgi:hypothetical protein